MKITAVPRDNPKEIYFNLQGSPARSVFFLDEETKVDSLQTWEEPLVYDGDHLFEDLSADTVLAKRDTQLMKSQCYGPAMQQDNLEN